MLTRTGLHVPLLQPAPGFWGTPTASVDWCEQNYAHSTYVCEMFNTISCVAMLLVGLLGALWHHRVLEKRFLLVFLSVALVGVGSTAFHGTLLFELQMLDELPMLYTATLLVYILLENRPERRFGVWFPAALAGYAALATCGAAFMRDQAQFYSFQVTFAALEFYGLYRTFLIHRKSRNPTQRRLFRVGITLYAIAIVLWFIDLRFCDTLVSSALQLGAPNPQLHAWWHVLVSAGLYALILVIAFDRCQVLGRQPRWHYRMRWVPVVVTD
ncbi:MAG TPA: ceramidase [Polyangiaceae bacterium]|nr:ceramidase [Polyangiaceae bacterium]